MKTIELVANLLTSFTAIIAIWLSIRALNSSSKAKKADNLIEVRKLFNEEHRKNVHKSIRAGEEIDDWPDLDDYLGTFELCYALITQDNLDLVYFRRQYGYRLVNILSHDEILIGKLVMEVHSWTNFFDLVKLVYPEVGIGGFQSIAVHVHTKYKKFLSAGSIDGFIAKLDRPDKDDLISAKDDLEDKLRFILFDRSS